jgi:hypothetical protein
MFPHHGFYNPMFCRPSRFIWFSIGSLATFAWMHYRKEGHLNCRRTAQVGYDGGSGHGQWGPLGRNVRFDEQHQQQQQWGSRQGADDPRLDANGGQRAPSPDASGRLPVDREFDRLREMSRNAEETISGMSEATIDSMMGGLQRLKERLAERRGQQLQASQPPSATTTPLATPPEESTPPHHRV